MDVIRLLNNEDFLMRHKKEVHNPKPQEEKRCEFCSYIAKNAKNYFQHMRRTHNIKKRINNRVFPLTAINLTKKKKE
ncbi:hypothetical protein PVAND_016633 [Polypedilum vanderplanki]|uniref:Uncharacterized protein n=1 Tax=Polypedilum vanderplanki TaxID=319348 RepID=A0A9J6BGC5_POLVA|nr:hypothetical protein PVAND_016633 [Polypedilum vanderplanki]